ncbi:MAG: glycosyltransferase family A protein [Candidatus Vogelbacteria bacterium]|nr:glycosyltransferase family A protein [Candidatus Vogelbacteria bacterium]
MRNLRVPGETAKKITKLSFIVPAYNEEARLGKCLESILAATANFSVPTEIIVVNNASTDKTKEVARSYPGIIVVDEPRKGLPSARQAGHLASTGEIEAHIDADTLMSPGWPEKVAIEFAKNPNLVALSGPYIYYDMSLLIRAGVKIWYGFAYLLHFVNHRVLKIGAIVQGGNFAVRKTALEKIGGFNLDAGFYSEDADLARRIQSTGRVKFTFFLPLKTSGRRFRGDGLFKTGWNYAVNHFWTMYRHRPFSREYKDIRLK